MFRANEPVITIGYRPRVPVKKAKPNPIDPAVTKKLLADVLADPDDDHARRVYADALIAAGDPRGEFIAVQCELAKRGDKTEKQDPKTKPLWNKFRELHSKHSGKWNKDVKSLARYELRWWWHRGFLRAINMSLMEKSELAAFAKILEEHPVTDLATGGDKKLTTQQLDLPGIERVTRLALYVDNAATIAAEASRLVNVRELRLGTHFKDKGILALAKPKALGKLTHLSLGAPDCKPAAFAKLATSPLGKRLEILEILREDITPELVKIILAMPKLKTFVYSFGYEGADHAKLVAKFGDRCIEENEPGTDYIQNGVNGVSYRLLPFP